MERRFEEMLQQVSDREAIRDLALRYCHVVWRADLDDYPKLFAEDGVMTWTDPGHRLPVKGHAALRELVDILVPVRRNRPFLHNHIVQLLGPDTAKGQCCVEVRNILDGKEGYLVVYYEDDYTKIDGEWKFKQREMTIEYNGLRSGYLPPEKTTASWFKA
jgi:hypothetical protein